MHEPFHGSQPRILVSVLYINSLNMNLDSNCLKSDYRKFHLGICPEICKVFEKIIFQIKIKYEKRYTSAYPKAYLRVACRKPVQGSSFIYISFDFICFYINCNKG